VNDSVQAAEDEGGWQAGGLCSNWRIANAQLLYHRNKFIDFVDRSVAGSGGLRVVGPEARLKREAL